MTNKLTDKQQSFVNEFVISNNATDAAIKAGYAENSARQIATENLSKPYIAELIKIRREQMQEMADLKAQDVLKGFCELATVSVVDLLLSDGTLDLSLIKAAGLGRFIQEFTIIETPTKEGVKIQTKVKGYSRMDALKQLSDIYGMKMEKQENPVNISNYDKAKQSLRNIINNFSESYQDKENIIQLIGEMAKIERLQLNEADVQRLKEEFVN